MSLEFYTNKELMDELFSRETFKGILLCESGERGNAPELHHGCVVRMSKGMVVKDLFDFMKIGLDVLQNRFPAAFAAFFGPGGDGTK